MANKPRVMYFLMFSVAVFTAALVFFRQLPQGIRSKGAHDLPVEMADLHYKRGVINFEGLHFKEAIGEWEEALIIINDRHDQRYKKIEAEIAIARKKISP